MPPSSPIQLNWDQVLTWRLGQQRLTAPAADPVALVSAVGGVQAQVMTSAAQVIGIRSTTPVDVDALLWTQRRLVKTWAMRGTLHLLPADEFPTWVAALRTREWRITPGWERYHGISGRDLDAITDAIPEVLGDDPITREELATRLAARLERPDLAAQLRSGWAAVFKPAANRGLLCQGPPVNANVTFMSPTTWLGGRRREPDTNTAVRTVVARFLDANGPATHEDVARWFGVPPKQGREMVTTYAGELAEVRIDGKVAWMTPAGVEAAAAAEPDPDPEPTVLLLPGFDPYVLAPISHRRHTIPAGRVDEVSRTAGWISPVLVVDGRIAGTWTSERSATGKETRVTITPFGRLPKRVVDRAREHLRSRWSGFLGPKLRITVDR
jgi:hypothetical protein